MKNYSRVYAGIDLDAVAFNFASMRKNIHPSAKMIAVIKATDTARFRSRGSWKRMIISGALPSLPRRKRFSFEARALKSRF